MPASTFGPAVVAVPFGQPADRLETSLMWRDGDLSPAREALRSLARCVFEPAA